MRSETVRTVSRTRATRLAGAVVASAIALTATCSIARGSANVAAATTTTTKYADDGNEDPAAKITMRSVSPADTDPGLDTRAGDHLVAVPMANASTGRLLVFFPGTRGRPDQYTALIRRAAELGYHAVSLDYENSRSINFQVCRNQPPGCHEEARLEILAGAESGYIEPDVDAPNSAFNRLSMFPLTTCCRSPGRWDRPCQWHGTTSGSVLPTR